MRLPLEEIWDFKPKTVAQDIAFARVKAARDARLGLPDAKEITDRTEGRAPQAIDITSGGEKLKTALVEFVGIDTTDDVEEESDSPVEVKVDPNLHSTYP